MIKLNLKAYNTLGTILDLIINYFLFFIDVFFIYIKVSSTKLYQDNKERLQKRDREWYQSFPIKEKEKKATTLSWVIQKSFRRWKTGTGCA